MQSEIRWERAGDFQDIVYEKAEGIARVTINRPHRRNAFTPDTVAELLKAFAELFPAWAEVEITHYWRGFVCLSHDLVPYIGALDEKKTVWTAIAYHGNGVAMGSWSGRAVARLRRGQD